MNLAWDWIAATDAVAVWLSTYFLHSTALIVPALLVTRWLGSSRLSLQEAVLRVALVGGLLTASLQSGLGWEAATGSIVLPSSAPGLEAPTERAGLPVAVGEARHGASVRGAQRTAVERTTAIELASATAASAVGPSIPWLAGAVAVWLFGALLLMTRLAVLAGRLAGALRDRQGIREGRLFRLFWRLLAAADIERPTALTRTRRLEVPLALGVGRREICLPQRVVDELPTEQQETVLAHELAHLERRDPVWLLAARVLESVLFLQPLNRVVRRRLQEVAECRCDDWAAEHTGHLLTLARCLTEVATWSQSKRAAALAPTMAGTGSSLGRRVRRLLAPGYSSLEVGLPSWWRPLAVVALIVVLVAVPGFSTGGQPVATQTEEQTEESSDEGQGRSIEPATEFLEPVPSLAGSAPQGELEVEPVLGGEGIVAVPTSAPVVVVGSALAGSTVVAPAVEIGPAGERLVVSVAPRVVRRVRRETRLVVRERWSAIENQESQAQAPSSDSREPESGEQDSERVQQTSEDRDHDWDDEDWEDEDWDDEEWGDEEWNGDWSDELEDEMDRIVDGMEESLEVELEPMLDALETELDEMEETFEETFEVEFEGFEESLEMELDAFEEEMELLEDRLEERFERDGSEGAEERFDAELERIEEGVDRLCDRLDQQMDRIEDRVESRLERSWGRDFERRLEPRFEALERRIDAETERLEAMACEMAARAEGGQLTAEDRELLMAEARRMAEEARPSPQEIDALRAELERMRSSMAPATEELEALRSELRAELEALRAQAEEGMAEQHRALDELRRAYDVE